MEADDDKEASLDCPVCMEQYDTGKRTPKMMPCLHTVCATCLVDLITSNPCLNENLHGGQSFVSSVDGGTAGQQGYIVSANDDGDDSQTFLSSPYQQDHNQFQHILNSRANGHAISNLATILQGNRHLPLRRLSVDVEPPPALPARIPRGTAPPRNPKPLVRPKPLELRTTKEPPIPRNIIFYCPLCRFQVDSSILQTNRYVIAHLRDLERLSTIKEPTSPADQTPLPPMPPDSNRNSGFNPENFWCYTCAKPCGNDCTTHNIHPMEEYVSRVNASLQGMLSGVEERLVEHTNNQEQTDTAFKSIFQTLNNASRHLWRQTKSTQEVTENLNTLKDDINSNEDSPTLQHALALTSKVECIRKLDQQLSELENGASSDDIYIWRQNNKLYISTREPDQTIMITVNESSSPAVAE